MSDPVSELGRVLSGESLERLKDVLVEPDADIQPGEMARIGAALSQLGRRSRSPLRRLWSR